MSTFTINRSLLAKELSLLQSVMKRKQLIPVLVAVRMELAQGRLTLTATDLDVTVITSVSAEGNDWEGCLPCCPLYELVKLFSAEIVAFTVNGSRMEVSAGVSKHLLPIWDASQFPKIDRASGEAFSLPLPQLTTAINAVSFAMLEPRDEAKPSDFIFTGLSLVSTNGTLTATASRKTVTAAAEIPCETDFTVLLPKGAVSALQGLQGDFVAIRVDAGHAEFTAENRTITARLLMGTFPDWRQFVPEYPYRATVGVAALTSALQRAQVTMDRANAVGFESMKATVTANQMLVETRGGDNGESFEPVAITSNLNGEPFTVGLFAHQVLSVLGKCGESVSVEMAAPDKPIGFTSEGAKYFVMPVRLKF